jgi:hypothetical protein
MVHLELDFRLVVEPRNLAGALPKLNVMAVNKLSRLFHGLVHRRVHPMTLKSEKWPSEPTT